MCDLWDGWRTGEKVCMLMGDRFGFVCVLSLAQPLGCSLNEARFLLTFANQELPTSVLDLEQLGGPR